MGSLWSRSNLSGALGLTARESKIAILIMICLIALVALFIFILLPATADGFNKGNSRMSTPGPENSRTQTNEAPIANDSKTTPNTKAESNAASITSRSEIHSTVVTSSDANSQSVTVNGQRIATPQNGTVRKTITANNGSTKTDVTISSHSSGGGGKSSSLELNVDSSNFTARESN